jgi:hypothetical protein
LNITDQKKDTAPGGLHELDLDSDGNCRINIFNDVPDGPTMLQYPFNRCCIVQSTAMTGQVMESSGFALSATRVLTSDIHHINTEQRPGPITVLRVYHTVNEDGSIETIQESVIANGSVAFGDNAEGNLIGLHYCMLATENSLNITDDEGDNVFTTITSVLSINPNPDLQLLTRRVPTGELVSGIATGAPRRVTFGSVAEWYVTNLGGWIGTRTTATLTTFLRGSPIFVTEEMGPLNGPLVSKAWLVGLVTDEVVASNPCTVNAGLFVDDGAVTRLLDAL